MRALRYDDIIELSPSLTIFRYNREIYSNQAILADINVTYLGSINPIGPSGLMLFCIYYCSICIDANIGIIVPGLH